MGTARNRPRASSSPYFGIHCTIIHFTQCKKTFSTKHKSDAVFCGRKYGQICRKYCFVRFLRAVYTKKFIQNTKGDVWQHFSRLFCHRRAQRFLEGINLEHRNPELTNLQMSCSRYKPSSWAIFKETYHCKKFQQLLSMKTLVHVPRSRTFDICIDMLTCLCRTCCKLKKRKIWLNAEVHATRKYNWLVPLVRSLIKDML